MFEWLWCLIGRHSWTYSKDGTYRQCKHCYILQHNEYNSSGVVDWSNVDVVE
jgi:hypothetical protein